MDPFGVGKTKAWSTCIGKVKILNSFYGTPKGPLVKNCDFYYQIFYCKDYYSNHSCGSTSPRPFAPIAKNAFNLCSPTLAPHIKNTNHALVINLPVE
jgi:hypothetical protein